MSYREQYQRSLADPAGFWAEAANAIHWIRKPSTILDDSAAPLYRWFTDGTLNTCFNALDRHVAAGRGDQTALIYDSPVTGTRAQLRLRRADRADREVRRRAARARGRPRATGC